MSGNFHYIPATVRCEVGTECDNRLWIEDHKLEYGSEEQEEEISITMGCLREELRGNVVEQNRVSISIMPIKMLWYHKWYL